MPVEENTILKWSEKGFYRVEKFIGRGGFGTVHRGKSNHGLDVVIKSDNNKCKISPLFIENEVYRTLNCSSGFPRRYMFAEFERRPLLVLEYCGHPLSDLLHRYDLYGFGEVNTARIAIRLFGIIQELHSKDFLHRDIKPANILINNVDRVRHSLHSKNIFLIDFGSAKKLEGQTGLELKEDAYESCASSLQFSSPRWHRNSAQCCRDDITSVVYVIAYFYCGRLPWSDIPARSQQEYDRILEMKENSDAKDLFPGCSKHFKKLVRYVSKIRFKEEIDYEKMKTFMKKAVYANSKKILFLK